MSFVNQSLSAVSLNLAALKTCIKSCVPFSYYIVTGLLDAKLMAHLYEAIPHQLLLQTQRTKGSDKTYQLSNLELVNHMTEQCEPLLPDLWQVFLTQSVLTKNYKVAMGDMIGQDLSQCFLQCQLKAYVTDDFISMHTDDKDVAATHLIFLNPHYHLIRGGCLNLHDTNGQIVVSIPPDPKISVVMTRSDCSYHSVGPCLAHSASKITLQIVFWKTKIQRKFKGRVIL